MALRAAQDGTEGKQGYNPHPSIREDRLVLSVDVQWIGVLLNDVMHTFYMGPFFLFCKKIPSLVTEACQPQTLWIALQAYVFP